MPLSAILFIFNDISRPFFADNGFSKQKNEIHISKRIRQKWNIPDRTARNYCSTGKIKGAF